jgi:hypothetical protein
LGLGSWGGARKAIIGDGETVIFHGPFCAEVREFPITLRKISREKTSSFLERFSTCRHQMMIGPITSSTSRHETCMNDGFEI